MNENSSPRPNAAYQEEVSILENPYEKEVQLDVWQHEKKKAMISMLVIGFIVLISSLIGFSVANVSITENWLAILLISFIVLWFGAFYSAPTYDCCCGKPCFSAGNCHD